MFWTKWKLFCWAEVMLALTVTSNSLTDCNKKIIIFTDLNCTAMNMNSCPQCQNTCGLNGSPAKKDILTGNLCFMGVPGGKLVTGNCPKGASAYTFNVTYSAQIYNVLLNDHVENRELFFIHNASAMVPSCNFSVSNVRPGSQVSMSLVYCEGLNVTNITVQNLCNEEADYDPAQCTGQYLYFLKVPLNGPAKCYRCTDPVPKPETSFINDTYKCSNQEAAVEVMDNLRNLVKSIKNQNKSSAEIIYGDSKGLIQIAKEEEDVSIGYNNALGMRAVLKPSLLGNNFTWYVNIPKEAFQMANSATNSTPFVGVLRFPSFTENNTGSLRILHNEVYGISMGANIINLTKTINISFSGIDTNGTNISCNSWDGEETHAGGKQPKWTTFGCDTINTSNAIQCSCTHLTFFALLMSASDQNPPKQYIESLTYITYIGCGLSTFFLLVGLFIHFVTWHSRTNQATTILMNLFVALCLLNITFLSNQQVASANDNTGCIIIAAVMHFSMLATFSWFFIQALHLYLMLIRVNTDVRVYKMGITALGWAFPALVAIIIAASGNYKLVTYVQFCWITNPYIHYIVNVGYYALIFIFAMIIFIAIVRALLQARISTLSTNKTSSKKSGAILSLFVVLGLTWGVAFFSYGAMLIPSYYIFTILNSFQGLFLFIYYYTTRSSGEAVPNEPTSSSASSIIKERISSETEVSYYDNVTAHNRVH